MSEELLRDVSDVLVTLVEAAGALVIFVGALWAAVRFLVLGVRRRTNAHFTPVRLLLGRFLTLGLEFQLAADVLRTAITPSFDQIGQLAAIAAIRTALNYFLHREIERERRELVPSDPTAATGTGHAAAQARPEGA
ncbi:DUF1622 domain-containing protein [Micromonospora sp. NPDC050397]|uniref:DUF1622 domain-containing protein n=1 Tax=Micromonospora sp. NPDC050397 TaxID=3364279 RepID=UPI00384A633B